MLILKTPEGYDSVRAPTVSSAAAQLDFLLASLRRRMRDATVGQLEWQLRPGVNTIGMLLAHLAVSETYWVAIFSPAVGDADEIICAVIGIHEDDDGMPLPAHGAHPQSLLGKTVADYFELLDRARAATHRVLRGWDDNSLEETSTVDGEEISRAWMLYHLVDHFAHHRGQIALLDNLRKGSEGPGGREGSAA